MRAPPAAAVPSDTPSQPKPVLPGYLSPKDAAVYVGISEAEMERMRRRGDGPKFCHAGERMVRYPVAELDKWMLSRLVSNLDEARERGFPVKGGPR